MKNFIYPQDFNDFRDGLKVKNAQINQWIDAGFKTIKKKIKKGVKNPSYSLRSGNAAVFIFAYKQDNDTYQISVFVSKNYRENTKYDFVL